MRIGVGEPNACGILHKFVYFTCELGASSDKS